MNIKCSQVRLCPLVISVCLIVAGTVMSLMWPVLLKHMLQSNLVLTPSSNSYEVWRKFPETLYIDFYFFNWTNPEEVNNKTVKPKFREVGPYRFRETKEKSNITWNRNGTVSFRHLKFWYYDDKSGNGDIHDAVTTINPVALAASYAVRTWNYVLRKGLSMTLTAIAPTVSITRSVSQMLFEGYDDPLIGMGKTLPFLSGTALPPWDKFGWFYTRNGSSDYEGLFNMGTGEDSTFGRLYSWNYWNQTPYFGGNCGKVTGSAGEFFPAYRKKDSISFFSPDLCRTITLTYVGERHVDNILGYKYAAEDYMFDNGTLFPENECFCNGDCIPSGMLNVSSCRYNSPSFASLPHFYHADPYYLDLVEGLEPGRNKHEFFIILEPTTGIPLEVSARLQINLLMQPVRGISLFENVPKIFIPVLWFEQKAKIPDKEAFMLKLLLNIPVICTTVAILLVFTGLLVCCCIVYKICTTNMCGRKKNSNNIYIEQQIPLKLEHRYDLVKKP